MPEPGTTLSHYRLVEKIGEGGMGQVWKATDTRLGREVALKLLPEQLTQDAGRLDRFAREAKLLASLNHSGIATLHDIDEHEGNRFIVMELVPGEDLAQRLKRGPLPVAEALDVALQIARAVEEAHGQGVVHRDLKPANVKLTDSGQVKVLDFGLAKAFAPSEAPEGSEGGLSHSPTMTSAGTIAGVILGTAAYMSPEQARGRAIDKRSDVWSFGVVLYELLTGDNPFYGQSVADSVGAIMHRDPDPDALPPETPTAIRRLLKRCLTRERAHRLHDIADARIEIEEAIAHPEVESPPSAQAEAAPPARSSKGAWAALLILLPLMAAAGWWIGSREEAQAPPRTRQFKLAGDVEVESPVISPDGTRIAYLVEDKLMIRSLDALEPRELAVEVGAGAGVFWSPDNRSLGVTKRSTSEILRVDLDGGAPLVLSDAADFVLGASWGDDGYIYFTTFQGGIRRVPEAGGAAADHLKGHEEMLDYHGFDALPGGRGFLTIPHLLSEVDTKTIYLEQVGREPKPIYSSDAVVGGVGYSPTGHVLFARQDTPRGLWAFPYSLDGGEATGEAFLVVADLDEASVSNTGDLVYGVADLQDGNRKQNVVWLDLSGKEVDRLDLPIYGANLVTVSPDGSKAALIATGVGRPSTDPPSVWVIDLERETGTRLTTERTLPTMPSWNADSTRIAYVELGSAPGPKNVVSVRVDGAGDRQLLMAADLQFFLELDRDWTRATFMRGTMQADSGMSIATQRVDEESWTTFVDTPGHDVMPQIHPNGKWLSYLSGDFPSMEVFVRPFPEGDGQWKVSSRGSAGSAMWSPDGSTLYYSEGEVPGAPEGTMFAVSFDDSGPAPSFGTPTKIFDFKRTLTVTPDERFVYVETQEPPPGEEAPDVNGIVLVESWVSRFGNGD